MNHLVPRQTDEGLQYHFPFSQSEYIAMQLSPLVYQPYSGTDGYHILGYAGAGIQNTGSKLDYVASYANSKDSKESAELMHDWTTSFAPKVLPETRDYPSEIVDEVLLRMHIPGVLAASVIELDSKYDRKISVAARTDIGMVALAVKRELGFKAPEISQRMLQYHSLKKQRKAFGPINYESIVVGILLINKALESQLAIGKEDSSKELEC